MKKMIIGGLICLCLAFTVLLANRNQTTHWTIQQSMGFSETVLMQGLTFEADEAEAVMTLLADTYTETDAQAGFSIQRTLDTQVFKQFYFALKIYPLFDQEIPESFKLSFLKLKSHLIQNPLVAIDYLYFAGVMKELKQPYDVNALNEKLIQYYDAETNLFFYRSIDDDIGLKLLISNDIVELCSEIGIDLSGFNVEKGVDDLIKQAEFKLPEAGDTFYNSGADLIYLSRSFDSHKSLSISLRQWFEQWKQYYDRFDIDQPMKLIDYYTYLQIAAVFSSPSPIPLQTYLSQLRASDIPESTELDVIYKIYGYESFRWLEEDAKQQCLDYVRQYLDRVLKSVTAPQGYNLGDLLYGTLLADAVGFSYDNDKVASTVRKSYRELDESITARELIYNTFYYLAYQIDQEEKTAIEVDARLLSETIDQALEKLLNQDDEFSYTSLRLALQIKSSLRIIQPDTGYLLTSHVQKIRDYLARDHQPEDIQSSQQIEMTRIQYLLDGEQAKSTINLEYWLNDLYDQGGFKPAVAEPADLLVTYHVYALNDELGLFAMDQQHYEELAVYTSHLKENELYYASVAHVKSDYRAILYALALKQKVLNQSNIGKKP